MIARLRSWWQKLSKPLIVIAITILVVGVLVLVILGYLSRLAWTGFFNKTLWDWLQLLIVPLVLAVVALLFQLANTRTERQIALDKQHEDLLQAYLDRIAELLLKESLRTSTSEEVRNVARVRTITVLTQLDARRIGYVFTFLWEAGLLSTTSNSSVISLKNADLRAVKWDLADLSKAHLSYANLAKADLSGANLARADLSGADLSGADLSERTFLNGADLSGAKVTEEQLKKAKSLKGAIMPDGSKHP